MAFRVLLLEHRPAALAALAMAFREALDASARVERIASAERLLGLLRADASPTVVVMSARPGSEIGAKRLIARARRASEGLPVVIAAEEGDVQSAACAIEAGANDFLVLADPLEPRVATLVGKLLPLVEALARTRRLHAANAELRASIQARFSLVGESAAMRRVLDRVERVASVPRPVLVTGERGTGKELVARAIHAMGGDPDRPIVTLNCAAFTDALLESELFGHERGAFTGAEATRLGAFEQANGGTLFLDEVGHMSLAFQQKILRVVEYGTYRRVGGSRDLETSARIVAATNADLREKIRRGEFLGDLYDRLTFETIDVPPLRQRKGDVAVLARHFLVQFAREIPAFQGKRLSESAIDALERYPFPGNVRELKNVIERAAYRDTEDEITPSDLGMLGMGDDEPASGAFDARVADYKRRLLVEALAEADGNGAEAARLLGLTYDQFRYHHKTLVAPPPSRRGRRR